MLAVFKTTKDNRKIRDRMRIKPRRLYISLNKTVYSFLRNLVDPWADDLSLRPKEVKIGEIGARETL